MPPRRNTVPSYLLHRASGQARTIYHDPVTGAKRTVYLGKHGTDESRREHARICAEIASGRVGAPPSDLSVNELALAYLTHAETYYRHPDGRPTSEVSNVRAAIRHVRSLYGHVSVGDFGPVALEAVRAAMVASGVARTTVNAWVGVVRRIVRWGVAQEMVRPEVLTALTALAPLKAGRCHARETEPVRAVADATVEATLPYIPSTVADMVMVQRLTGARPGEVRTMRGGEIDRTDVAAWVYRPAHHKTRHRGRDRTVYIGPRAQAVLAPYLLAYGDGYLFRSERGTARCYRRDSYRQAIVRACRRAGVPAWHPNQLRHSAATALRAAYGVEASRVVLGHTEISTTEIYAERDASLAKRIVGETG